MATNKMGRPRGFDEDAALDAAMRVFWEKSYEGTTMSDLTRAMGINRSSMYAAFGHKEELYRRALERYRERPMEFFQRALEEPTLRDVIRSVLNGMVEFLSSPANPRGCLSLQGALACGTGSQSAQRATVEWRKTGEELLRDRFVKAQKQGELNDDLHPGELARYIAMLMAGLGVQAANGASRSEMKHVVAIAVNFMGY